MRATIIEKPSYVETMISRQAGPNQINCALLDRFFEATFRFMVLLVSVADPGQGVLVGSG